MFETGLVFLLPFNILILFLYFSDSTFKGNNLQDGDSYSPGK